MHMILLYHMSDLDVDDVVLETDQVIFSLEELFKFFYMSCKLICL